MNTINIDFKIINTWDVTPEFKKRDLTTQDSIESVNIKLAVDWMLSNEEFLHGGYAIDYNGEPWNGNFDEDIKANEYFIDHLGGAESFLRAVVKLIQGQSIENWIWQVDGSHMKLELLENGLLKLEDKNYDLKEIEINWKSFLKEFHKASNSYLMFLEKLHELLQERNEDNTWLHKVRQSNTLELKNWRNNLNVIARIERSE
ncbi:hypothetical protein KAU33_08695 [Candidatus Dependentiae bacterium]|nr:hypothetical protein [Candidatus Dependentiae bacterium]